MIIWSLLAFLAAIFSYIVSENREESANIWLTYLYSFSYFSIWALLTTIVYAVVKISGGKELKSILLSFLVHLPLGILFSLIHTFSYFSFIWLIKYTFFEVEDIYSDQLHNSLSIGNTIVGLLIYILTVITTQSVLFFNNYQKEQARNLHLQNELSKSQLQALKMQLQPHFLFNTLHSISSLNLSNPYKANEMIARLGEFLRMTLDNCDRQTVTLDEELGFARHYLEIEQIRFSDRLKIEINVRDDLLSAKVPHLILQPIVENAVKHGIAPFAESGRILINAEADENSLIIKVADFVSGRKINSKSILDNNGKGLQNVRKRLEQTYGKDSECVLIFDEDKNEHITILKIPFINESISNVGKNR